ncbi:uncharacterized protein LOC120689725 [Panicum virgatum]|uniref:uncharacterized protein LOC120689725 n=1 Tax=Panicum virgatum TaxID=38727 RepID=UPI0019D5ABB0|nr:uncharacterized protein LOC120689725 [Panicum virgatum]
MCVRLAYPMALSVSVALGCAMQTFWNCGTHSVNGKTSQLGIRIPVFSVIQYSIRVQYRIHFPLGIPFPSLLPRRSLFSNPCLLFASLPSRFRDELAKDGTPPHGPGSGRGNTAVGAGILCSECRFTCGCSSSLISYWHLARIWPGTLEQPDQEWRVWLHCLLGSSSSEECGSFKYI